MSDEPAARPAETRDESTPDSPSADPSFPGPWVPWPPAPKFQDRRWLHAGLLLLTLVSTTLTGADWYQSFSLGFLIDRPQSPISTQLLHGLWYSITILAILGCHELGHYFACRYYDVDASLPFFIPMPILLTGTLGAFIRIREPIPTKRLLFDIGIAGPIAGFVVAVPALVLGLAMSRFDPPLDISQVRPNVDLISFSLGEPLLFRGVAWLVCGPAPEGYSLNWHPVAFAAWFGLLATALNLFPIGQLDGGHIAYAVLGRKSSHVTLATLVAAIGLSAFSSSWVVWTGLMVVMLVLFGRHHPRTFDEDEPLDRTRQILALVALVMFVVCFTPAPIEVSDFIAR
jgi:membrane-associated protease RseP (regulator of RpoE activity)